MSPHHAKMRLGLTHAASLQAFVPSGHRDSIDKGTNDVTSRPQENGYIDKPTEKVMK